MKIIVVGDGKVGYTLSDHLSKEGHDITIIDNDMDVLQKTIESLDVITIKGNGASVPVLEKAGAGDADLVIAVTSTDELNMLICLLAKKLGVGNTIARIRNTEYNEQLNMMQEDMGLNMVVNPERISALEISHLISFPSAINVGVFADDRVYLVEYKIQPDNPLDGQTVSKIHQEYSTDVLICAVSRESEIFVPNGDFVIRAGDHIFIAGEYESIRHYIFSLGDHDNRVKSVMLIGGGLISQHLSHMLAEKNIQVKIIEKNKTKCEQLSETLPHALIICGDGIEKALLDSEGIANVDALIAMTDMDEENLIISMYAVYKGVPKVVTKINRLEYADVIQHAGIDRVISPKYITANHIVRYVRGIQKEKGSYIKTLYRIMGKSAEVVEFIATSSTKHLGIPLSRLPLKKDLLITTIVRDNQVIIP